MGETQKKNYVIGSKSLWYRFVVFFRCVGIELGRGKNKVIALTFHPGVLDTDLSRPYHRSVPADHILTADASAEKLIDLMSSASLKDSGRFIDVSGTDIPW